MTPNDTLLLGAVAYDAKVVTIWEGFKAWFDERGLPFDFILYSNYEKQVEEHFAGRFHVAWNSPLAWLQAERFAAKVGRTASAIAMRDTDQDLKSVIAVRADSPYQSLGDLKGKTVAVGAMDSPQATLIPLSTFADAGLEPGKDFEVQRHDKLVGKHGDHVGGERDAMRALVDGAAEAACLIDGNYLAFTQEGTLPPGATRVLGETPLYDHCNFTVLDGAPEAPVAKLSELLFSMSYDDPKVRPLLDLEGLKQWKPGRIELYAPLAAAIDRFGTIEPFLAELSARQA